MGKRSWVSVLIIAGVGCSADHGQSALDGAVTGQGQNRVGDGRDAVRSDGAAAEVGVSTDPPACPGPAASVDLCTQLASGTVTACSHDGAGQPSPLGYLEIRGADGSQRYVCAVAWIPGGSGGYLFSHQDQFMSDPASCCGGNPTATAAPTAVQPAIGYLGAPHAPRDIKPQESAQPGAGLIRQNPFAVILQDASGGDVFAAALAKWKTWAGDGQAHPAPDGSGAYYFPAALLVNYTILETADSRAVAVVGPEVSTAADGSTPLGHPTLGGCETGGGAALVLIAGEIFGTSLTNHSGRFGHDPSETEVALENAQTLFNCFGVRIDSTKYYPPKP